MADRLDPRTRSRVMSAIRGRDTTPELQLRRAIWGQGGRYRVHNRSVFGTPDLSHTGRKVAVFVDGCFWHGCPQHYRRPASNLAFWDAKLAANRKRRVRVRQVLRPSGWTVVELWECKVLANPAACAKSVVRLLVAAVPKRTRKGRRPRRGGSVRTHSGLGRRHG